jgi:hypothetical protein
MSVERAVNRFLENPIEPGAMRMFTSAQTLVDQDDYHRHRYDTAIRTMEQEDRDTGARSLARRAFTLASPLKILEAPNGSGRLFFSVHPRDEPSLDQFKDRLSSIESLEEPDEENLLYVEFARGALAKDRVTRREQILWGRDAIASQLRHPTARYHMTATGLRIVTRDMMYPLKDDASPLPPGE